ncbi:AraC family transcriptional regulator [Sporocytophaga myxococcoides]|uniref:AraC family transcriptional regulator n=1 Tax=Sporocytophaga myxococcoides TaxID=153721 RepID=UPI0021CF9585|nr:AraC family transcriptional regulator [Sporocytophaga myxococcoides]
MAWDKQVNLHQQDFWELTYIIGGRGTRVIGDAMGPFSEGEVILIPPHIPHCWSFDEDICDKEGKIENICIFFSDVFLKNNGIVFPELEAVIKRIMEHSQAISFGGSGLSAMQRIVKSMIRQNKVERLSSMIRLLPLIAQPEIANTVGGPVVEDTNDKRMQLLQLYVMNNFQNTITLDMVSKFIGMEKASFCVFFKKMTKTSFFSYLTEYRIEASCKLLLNTSLSVAEVCNASGFSDVPYYNRVFKRLKGMTPTQYRTMSTKNV